MVFRRLKDGSDYQKSPSETSSGNLRSSLLRLGHTRPEMKPQIDELLKKYAQLFAKIDSLNFQNTANGVRILNRFWRLTTQENLSIEATFVELEKYVEELEKSSTNKKKF